jgi:hypothetical protein
MRAANFCRPVGPEIVMFRIQGQRATRSPLATFSTRLRRSDPGLRSRRASGARTLDQSNNASEPRRGRQTRAAIFCRPVGPEIVMFRIQGQRAARSPLATFSTRLRRSDPGLGSRRASGARTLDQSNNASEPRRGDRRARLISVGPLGLELLCLGSRGSALRARPWLPSRRAFGAQIRGYVLVTPAALWLPSRRASGAQIRAFGAKNK